MKPFNNWGSYGGLEYWHRWKLCPLQSAFGNSRPSLFLMFLHFYSVGEAGSEPLWTPLLYRLVYYCGIPILVWGISCVTLPCSIRLPSCNSHSMEGEECLKAWWGSVLAGSQHQVYRQGCQKQSYVITKEPCQGFGRCISNMDWSCPNLIHLSELWAVFYFCFSISENTIEKVARAVKNFIFFWIKFNILFKKKRNGWRNRRWKLICIFLWKLIFILFFFCIPRAGHMFFS